jgi:3',5'-cyclic AMP phosphodiesterase CpdA
MAERCLALHLSDPHFGSELPGAVDALVALAVRERPGALLLSGDITHRAAEPEFEAALRCIARIAAPRQLAVPGNHDLPLWDLGQRLFDPYGRFLRAFDTTLSPLLQSDCLWAAGVCSAPWWRHQRGHVSAACARQAAEQLQAAPAGALRLVVVHHPPVLTGEASTDQPFWGAQAALDIWRQAGVHGVLCGHGHQPRLAWPGGPGGQGGMWVAQGGTGLSTRLQGSPPSVNLLRGGGLSGWVLERWDYDGQAFSFVSRQALS